jgi:hypothetical protein
VNDAVSTAVIIASLALAAWGALTAVLDRPAGRSHEAGAALVELGLVALAVGAVAGMVSGDGPAEPAVFVGYLITTLALLPAGVIMARMEPTRWGSAIIAGAALVVPVLIVRLQQLHG